ncbi:alpha-L-rhamnosidase C-terminal domain-containing protein [Arthrobacter sp. UC242_113]|uniref:alpha-L-rhamnosidase C-terminal domain-containing protein n=1 Tax=Arthrobacter sp. UC242_113 TaxID=3374550 RepID=UPI0037573EB5
MTSFNHYAFGSVGDWMHRVIGGLEPLEPGYGKFLVTPRPGGQLTWAATSLETPYGRAAVRWDLDCDVLTVIVEVPEGTSAVVRIPECTETTVGPGVHRFVGGLPSSAQKMQP